jgi:dTDP-glucose pyrophosphorylase
MNKSKLESLLIPMCTSIKQAMQKLSETAEKILFVVDEHNTLLGTVTDGDIRSGLLNGLNFNAKVEKVMYQKFISLRYNERELNKYAEKLMIENKIEQIPILDKDNRIIDAILWTDIFGKKEYVRKKQLYTNHVVIMAGGRGERLDPFTRILPKPLIPIDEKPIIEIIMDKFYKHSFHNFVFTLNYKKEYIKFFLKDNSFPYNIDWVEEEDYMGTAGSLSLLKDKVKETFFVLNCDTILNADYIDILEWHKENNNLMTLIGCHKEIKIPYGILELDNGILNNFVEKPNYDVIINTGTYVLEPEILHMIPENKCMDMNTLIGNASKMGKVSVYPVHDGWVDIGQWEEYKKTVKKFGEYENI